VGNVAYRKGTHMGLGISLLISCFNRTRLFCHCYPTWLQGNLEYPTRGLPDEIIILNDGGATDLVDAVRDMEKLILDLGHDIPVIYKHRDKGHTRWSNPAVPHNWLVRQAKGPIVLIIDPEVGFITDGLPLIHEFYQTKANRISSCSAGIIYSVQSEFMHACEGLPPLQVKNLPDISTDPTTHQIILRHGVPAHGCRAWWKERYVTLGGKDERYLGWGYEDLDLAHRNIRFRPGPGQDFAHMGFEIVEYGHAMPPAGGSGPDTRSLWEQSRPDGIANEDIEWGVIQ